MLSITNVLRKMFIMQLIPKFNNDLNSYSHCFLRAESSLDVIKNEPWYSKYGLYDHYYIQYSTKGGVQYLPR